MTLQLDHLTVTVADGPDTLTILDGLDLTVEAGTVVALTGASGSGKSTLLAVAGLLRQPTAGTVTIDGIDATALSRTRATRLRGDRIGFVFQAASLFPSLTAIEQLELVAHLTGRLDADARRRAAELLVAVGLEHRRDARPAQLSGGERQRVGIARGLMNGPSLLLADEPTAALDDERGRDIMAMLVTEASRREVATLIVTHNPAQLPPGTRHLVLSGGRVRAVEPVAP
ncbi:ABC transporter ATP-binding protein [Aquihabitans sp. McL0605]|uniref:ABC transporter ATP-binding protein n=1 Tax=Aquihabitans sp. McL0605 TaxID=3415671 RepID=UPI003CF00877